MKPTRGASGTGVLHWLRHKILYSISFGLAVLVVMGAALFHFSDLLKPKPDIVRIAYSAGGPARKHLLDEMALNGRKWNLDIQLIPTPNTDTSLTKIDQQIADVGLIAGAIEDRAARKVVEITPLYMEPLQLVVKAELYDSVSHDFGQLKGKSISMDNTDSATDVLATELLRFMGLADPATGRPLYRPIHIEQSQLFAQQDTAAMPDAIFQIGGVPSATIASLVANHDYRVMALPFGGAFNLSQFRESKAPKPAPGQHLGVNKAFIEEAVIPAYVYGVLPAVPATDTRTIAARLILVGGQHLKKDVVVRILGLVMSPEISHVVEPQLTVKLLENEFQFQRHPGTDAYLASLKPFDLEDIISRYHRTVEIWGIFGALYLAVANAWKWWRERQERKPKHSVGDFLSQVLEVEAELRHAASDQDRRVLE